MDDSNYHEQWLTIGLHFVSSYFFLFFFTSFETLTPDTHLQNVSIF